jgi:hypothetical protein
LFENAPIEGAFFLSKKKKEKIFERANIVISGASGMRFAVGEDYG